MNAEGRQYYTSSDEFSKVVLQKMKEKATEHCVLSLYDIEIAAPMQGPLGVRLYMHKGEQLFATRIDQYGFYLLKDPDPKFKPEE